MADDVERDAASAACERDDALRGDARRRRAGGIVHTPAWVARFVVAETARALAEAGGAAELAGATVIDPAVGTGVFPAAVLALGYRPARIVGIDVDESVIGVASEVLSQTARERDVKIELRVGDALEMRLRDAQSLVVLGNPPWAARSGSRGLGGSDRLVAALRPAGERRSGVLSDAYVRFLAWACASIDEHGGPAALGLVTNGSFVDGPVHALLRERIAQTFDRVEIVDLGGGSLVARRAGTRDENVFGVRPPAAITIAARRARPAERERRIVYVRVSGSVADKEKALSQPLAWRDVSDARRSFAPRAPRTARWDGWTSVAELFPFHREGVQSNRDALVVDVDRAVLLRRLHAFAHGEHDELGPTRTHFDPAAARRALRRAIDDGTLEGHVVRLAYRPLDTRFACLHPAVCHRARPDLREAMAHGGLALVTARKDRGDVPWAHFGVVTDLVDNCWLSTRSSCRARAFPAYTPDGAPNVDARRWEDALGVALPHGLVLAWTLAILASPAYRARHGEELHGDYARIPRARGVEELEAIAAVGRELAAAFVTGPRSSPTSPEGRGFRDVQPIVRIGHVDVRAAKLATLIESLDELVEPVLA